jgi:hypothetical protein
MIWPLARIIGVGIETADVLVHEILSRNLRDRKAVARDDFGEDNSLMITRRRTVEALDCLFMLKAPLTIIIIDDTAQMPHKCM